MKKIAMLLCLAMLFTALAGCAPAAPAAETEAPAAEEAAAEETAAEETAAETGELPVIRYGVMGGMVKAGLVVLADKLELDKEEGVDIQLVNTASSADALTSITTGKDEMDVWGFQVMPSCNFIANGADLVIFGGSCAEGGAMICAKGHKDEFKDINNFKGKTILGIRGETGFITFIGLLVNAGYDMENDVNIIWTDAPSVLEGVAKGEGDVGFLPIEYTYFEDDSINAEVVCHVGELAENYICCRMTTSQQILDAKRDDFVKVLKAIIRAYAVYQNDHETTKQVLAEYAGQTEEFIENNIYNSCIKLTPDPYSDAIGPFYEVLRTMGFFDDPENAPDVYDHVDVSLYKQALDEVMAAYPDEAVYQDLLAIFERQNTATNK